MEKRQRLDRVAFPEYGAFSETCLHGLLKVHGLSTHPPDPAGWNTGQGFPPSYFAFGRMRSLMALDESLRLDPRRVLELAAGDGRLASALAVRGVEVVANDLRADTLASCLAGYGAAKKIRIAPGNLFDLKPEELGTFDLVIAREVIEHVAHPDELLSHLGRFVSPNGSMLLTTPNGFFLRNQLPTFREIEKPASLEPRQFQPDADGHLFLLTPEELASMASRAGLEVKFLGVWGTPALTGHLKLGTLSSEWLMRPAYVAEVQSQSLPARLRARVCSSIVARLALRHSP